MRSALVPALALALWSTGCVVHRDVTVVPEELRFDEPVDALWIDNGSGSLDVRVDDVPYVIVYRTLRYSGSRPDLEARVQGNTLLLDVDCRVMAICQVDYEILLPTSAALEADLGSGGATVKGLEHPVAISTGSGSVDLTDISGDIDVEAGSGALHLRNVSGMLYLDTGSGQIDVDGTPPEVVASAGSGSIDLRLEAVPHYVQGSTGSGSIDLTVPSSTYCVHTDTGSGSVNVSGITVLDSAPDVIDLETGSGSISILGR